MAIVMIALIFAMQYMLTLALNCKEIKEIDSIVKFTPEDLKTLKEDELNDCFSLLGKDKLSVKQAETLWHLILKSRGPLDQMPEEDVRLLGWISKGIPADHFLNMSFTDIDTIAAFGQYYDLSYDQLSALRDAVMDQWSNKEISDLSSYDISNLGHILCAFNSSDIEMIHPDAYRDAAIKLSLLKNCSVEVIKSLAKLAISDYGFGNPSKWTAFQVSAIGCVIAGIPDILSIPSEAFKGVTPDIVGCLPKTFFQGMSEAQLRMLSASSGVALGEVGLSDSQGAAVEKAILGPTMENSAVQQSPGMWLLLCIVHLHISDTIRISGINLIILG